MSDDTVSDDTVSDDTVSDDAAGDEPRSEDAAAATSEPSGPDLAHRALAEAKAAAVRARLSPSEEERMRAAAARGVRRREQAGQRRGGKGGDPVPFGAAINALLAARGWQGDAQVAAVMGRWDSLVGEALADKCAPVSLTDGELLMSAVSTAWATQLRLMTGQLKERLNAELGAGAVTSIRVQGPSGGPRRSGAWRVSGGRGPRDTYG